MDKMKTVSPETLLRVMDREKYEELRKRGKLAITKRAPDTEILLSSIPIRYRHKLTAAR